MIVLSCGIPKSGSTLLMVYARELIALEYGERGQNTFQNWVKDGPVGGVEAYPNETWCTHIEELNNIANLYGPFVLKTHKPYYELENLIRNYNLKVICSIRDPRDIVLSAIDHGFRSRAMNSSVFAECLDLDVTISHVKNWCEMAMHWIQTTGVEVFRYENLVQFPEDEVYRIANYLGVTNPSLAAKKVVMDERMNRQPTKNQFNKGLAHRYSVEMIQTELIIVENTLKKYIQGFGYALLT